MSGTKRRGRALGLVSILLFGGVHGASPAQVEGPPDATELVRRAWDQVRGESSYGRMTMIIHRPDWERTMSMRAWTRGTDHSLVRILEPRKDAGSGTLMVEKQMWTYAPKINRVIKVPSSMMAQSWMGSDFSNKDVSRADDIVTSYDHRVIGEESHDGKRVWVIESVPHEDAAVVWGKEVLKIREDDVLLAQEFYDQDGGLVKAMVTLEIGELGGRMMATPPTHGQSSTPRASGPRSRFDEA